MIKPEYYVPSMKEVARIPHNGFNVVSTFSGAGGSCLGYRLAGYRVLWASEFIKEAQATYKANHPSSYLDTRDIRQVKPEEILKVTGLKVGEIDILDGSPPCAAFSTMGKRDKGWGEVKKYSDSQQRVDDLFFEYTRLLKALQPKVFVAENVSGLVKGTAKGYFIEILRALKSCGYRVKAKILNAKYLGIPTSRERLIFVGVRNDLELDPVFPRPKDYMYTLKDALEGAALTDRDYYAIPKGGKYMKLWEHSKHFKGYFGQAHKHLYGNENMIAHRRATWNRSAPTLKQGAQDIYHPAEPRTLTIGEIKRISSFPDDFVLTGSFRKKWERVGRAVPPFMMMEVAKAIEEKILSKALLGGKI